MKYATRVVEAVLLACFVFLLWSNIRLRSENRSLRTAARTAVASPARSFQAGDAFSASEVVTCRGCSTRQWPGGGKIVLIVNPSCGSCEEVAQNLKDALPSLRLKPVVISTGDDGDTTKFARKYGFSPFMFRVTPGPEHRKFATTPQILLADDTSVIARCTSFPDCSLTTMRR